jgi:Flp pilus assembly protein TadD/NAD-dependent dihydropyrimidine dehydrogenase PreA subunit
MLKKAGIKPRPFRSRILLLAPLALAIYMFVWPSVYRWWVGVPRPKVSNHLMTADFWATFPGPAVAILTFALCGFVIIYFLGAKGFCTYACPYGGFFALADQVAPGRIIVTDACEHCGHCTAVCSSNVRVHEEVALYGMVVDPGCMKCMDCVSVCPNDALYFGLKRPSIGAKPASPRKPTPFDFTLAEEWLMIVIGVAALLVYRGLYGQIPLLLAMGMAAMTAYLVMKLVRLIRDAQVRLQNLQLKRGRRLTWAGWVFTASISAWLVFSAHSAAVQYNSWRGRSLVDSLALGDEVWQVGTSWWDQADEAERARLATAIASLERADQWGIMETPLVLLKLVWAQLARGDADAAEQTVRRLITIMPDQPEPHRGLAGVLRKIGRLDEAEASYRKALEIDPAYARARDELASLFLERGRPNEALVLLRTGLDVSPVDTTRSTALGELLIQLGRAREAISVLEKAVSTMQGETVHSPDAARLHAALATALMQTGQFDRGLAEFRRAVELAPESGEAHYNLGYALLSTRQVPEAIEQFQRAIELDSSVALWHYNLGVATFMAGRPADAEQHVRDAVRLDPTDPQAWGFLSVVLTELGWVDEARAAQSRADALLHP